MPVSKPSSASADASSAGQSSAVKKAAEAADESMNDVEAADDGDDDDEDEEDDEDDESDESDHEPIVYMQQEREKRVTAGNKMRELLADEALLQADEDDRFKEEADDDDFAFKDEKDVFDSDFGTTDEEDQGQQDPDDADEDGNGKKRKKRKPAQAFIPTFAKQTKHPSKKRPASGTDGADQPAKKKKRDALFVPTRESTRKSAQLIKQSVEARLKEADEKRAQKAPKPKKQARVLTQTDLIEEALMTEEINRKSLLAFYAAEEDRRALERQARKRVEITGPKLTWISTSVGLDRTLKPKETNQERGRRRLIEVLGESGKEGWKPDLPEDVRNQVEVGKGADATSSKAPLSAAGGSKAPIAVTRPGAEEQNVPPSATSTAKKDEPYTRNYVCLSNFVGTKQDELRALFGSHSTWEKMPKTGKTRKATTCPITGKAAKYRHPATMTPYATIEALRTIEDVVKQKYVWNDTLGAYTGVEGLGCQVELAKRWGNAETAVAAVKKAPPTASSSKPSLTNKTSSENPYAVTYTNSAARRKSTPAAPAPAPSGTPSPAPTGPSGTSMNVSLPTVQPVKAQAVSATRPPSTVQMAAPTTAAHAAPRPISAPASVATSQPVMQAGTSANNRPVIAPPARQAVAPFPPSSNVVKQGESVVSADTPQQPPVVVDNKPQS